MDDSEKTTDCGSMHAEGVDPCPPKRKTKSEWDVYERKFCIDWEKETFTKTEIPVNTNLYGEETRPWMSRERITNEFLTLQLIREATTIPVPEPLSMTEEDGAVSVTVKYIYGVMIDDLAESIKGAAVLKADKFIRETVLPQLASLQSDRSGALTGHVIPPRRVAERFKDVTWDCIQMPTKVFTFCHNDLAQHNILCHEETGDVVAIIDWEYAGYYEPGFETPLWLRPYTENIFTDEEVDEMASQLR